MAFWNFFKGKGTGAEPAKENKLHRPKDIPSAVGRDLVVDFGKEPNWVWRLKAVERPREGMEHCYDVRVFDENQTAAQKVRVRDFTSLDDHPELILVDGWYNKRKSETHLNDRTKKEPMPRAA
jgi:hypothetical protein